MATENPIRMLEDDGSKKWPSTVDPAIIASAFSSIAGCEGFAKVLNECNVLREQTRAVPHRSGSAPPTIEGSIASLQAFIDQKNSTLTDPSSGLLDAESEEQLRMDPGYIAYYYANVNLNPRLPPPILSRENRHLVRLMGHFGSKMLTSEKEGFLSPHTEEPEEDMSAEQSSGDQLKRSVTEQKKASSAFHSRGQVDLKQGEFPEVPSPAPAKFVEGEFGHDSRTISTDQDASCSGAVVPEDAITVNYNGVASVSCNESPAITLEDNASTQSNFGSDISIVESRMKSLNVSGGLVIEDHQRKRENVNSSDKNRLPCHPLQRTMNQVPGFQGHVIHQGMPGLQDVQPFLHNPAPAPPLYAATAAFLNSGCPLYPGLQPPGFFHPRFSGFSPSSVFHPAYYGGYLPNSAFPVPNDAYSALGFSKQPIEATSEINPYTSQRLLRPSFSSPLQVQFLQQPFDNARRSMVHGQLTGRNGAQGQIDVRAPRKDSDTFSVISDKDLCHPAPGNLSISAQATESRVNYYGHPPTLGISHFPAPCPVLLPASPMPESNHPGPGNDLIASQNSPKNVVACSVGSGHRGSDSSDDSKRNSFLELLKSCNSRKLELSDISGQIVEFSTDQHGSRFIQQKLEYCSIDEKESVFREVFPHASKLMIDVFGNYVIQKFFEHGTAEHRKKLGEQLTGHIVTLSLQMYGCRVIQKALDVIELNQKVKLVQELHGHVMRCVYDQNGNHVIQKCIESVPIENIGFIISSFIGEVATLSSHPYGCRVIQRVLEHCSDEQIILRIIDEILESACSLAQDPYGNYVTQHVLETGKAQQRSQIISKLVDRFVQLSQHKFASNVVEKCLKYGDASERNLIIEEMVVQSDDVLLMMMKDQFANYVLQKIFDIGSDKQRGILLSCIRSHLPTLKKFPYTKRIVARYEQLSEVSVQEDQR